MQFDLDFLRGGRPRCQVAMLGCLLMIARNHEGEVCKPWLAKGARLGSLGCGFIKARPRGVASSSGRSWCGFGKA
ncbi:hypothetical protein TIFTF001_035251 [Ficus carica]|uniref:Uncharacterized protein n=1 Tax=Ficus carica TaxID=3494 RepID=A0AA88E1B6_FICCA|nr:hypothetical protein TIFTF001_035251 [Ficus carica]